jgi:S-methylmethionine-dependent homocysteine/selenocysteine methylase
MEKGNITILDGGMGHELKRRGISDGTFVAGALANEKYSTSDIVETIHQDYLAAHCDVITTNSFVAVSYCKSRAS